MQNIFRKKSGFFLFFLSIAGILLAGTALTVWMTRQTDRNMRQSLLRQAKIAAACIDPARIRLLTGTERDLESNAYQTIKQKLQRARLSNPDCRFLYLMGRKDNGEVFFFVDSQPSGTEDYAPPGLLYEEVSPEYLAAFKNGEEKTAGPVKDRWGALITALVPVKDPDTGNLVAVLGMDVLAENWHVEIMKRCLLPAALTILAILAGFGIRQGKFIREQERTNRHITYLTRYLDNIINSMPSVLIGVDDKCRITHWNSAAEKRTGISADKARNGNLFSVFPELEPHAASVTKALQEGQMQEDIPNSTTEGGQTREENVMIYPLKTNHTEGAVIRIDDVTDRKRLQDTMIQNEKMISLGRLAAGMAHEINNPLSGIVQNTEVAKIRLTVDMPANEKAAENAGTTMEAVRTFMQDRNILHHLDLIYDSGMRAAAIVSNMLDFARKSESTRHSCRISDLIDKTLELARTEYNLKKQYDFRKIKIVKAYDSDNPYISCEPGKIQQVLLNILKNGAEEMAANNGQTPQFIIRTNKETRMVRIEIQDNGPGMDRETIKHLFDPFFTTKQPGAGTGLGLSVSYFLVVEDHQGEITVESEKGKGSTFIIRLPRRTDLENGA